ncbi:dihydrolipoyl dehydrogenase family protein [Caldiplasma sukawensis]
MKIFDVAIIGNGASAFSAAIHISEITKNQIEVAMIGNGQIGGTCVNRGCVPSKHLLAFADSFRNSNLTNVNKVDSEISLKEIMERIKDFKERSRITKYEEVLKYYGNVTYIEGIGKFDYNESLRINNHDEEFTIKAENYVVATGSHPKIPLIEGLSKFITSDTIWNLKRFPESLVILGGGYIACEIGQALSLLGVEVQIITRGTILGKFSDETRNTIKESLEQCGIKIHENSTIRYVEEQEDLSKIHILKEGKNHIIETQSVMVATGRIPNTENLNLEKVSVKLDSNGYIIVDDGMKTTNSHIYGAGDCIRKERYLETTAAREGMIAAENIMGGNFKINHLSYPEVIFTRPNILLVGFSEKQLIERKIDYRKGFVTASANVRSSMMNEKGHASIFVSQSDGRLLGAEICMEGASEFAPILSHLIAENQTYRSLIDTPFAFPTRGEIIKTAAQSLIRDINRMSCCIE